METTFDLNCFDWDSQPKHFFLFSDAVTAISHIPGGGAVYCDWAAEYSASIIIIIYPFQTNQTLKKNKNEEIYVG